MVTRMRLLGGLFAVLTLTLVGVVAGRVSADAAPHHPGPTVPYTTGVAPKTGSTGASSGVAGVQTSKASTSASNGLGVAGVCVTKSTSSHGTATVTCSGFGPNTPICEGLDSAGNDLGSGSTDSGGGFGDTVTLPDGTSGSHTIYVGPCTDGAGADALSVRVAGSDAGGTALTGVAVAGIGGLGVVLLVAGGLLVLAGRRRGSHTGA